jgi:hypothetical protein
MEHPLIGNLDDLNEEQLLSKIAELNKKLVIAHRMGNYHLCNQIRLALNNFQSKYTEKLRKDDNTPFTDSIDIS